MGKYKLFGFLLAFIIIVTLFVDSVMVYDASLALSASAPDSLNTPEDFGAVNIFSALGTWWDILTFNIEGVPTMLNLIFVPINGIALYMGVDIIKDLVPFT